MMRTTMHFIPCTRSKHEVNIKYNTETKAGRVKAPAYFEDSDWHCWNEQFQDTDCGQ